MKTTRISGAIFLILMIYILAAGTLLPQSTDANRAALGTTEHFVMAALSLGWFFAVWAALVAAMVFLIFWMSTGIFDVHETATDAKQEAAKTVPSRRVVDKRAMARAS